jgi:hypothetical protein
MFVEYELKYNIYAFASLLCRELLKFASQAPVHAMFPPLNKGAIDFSTR